jgi:hypothetical protein
VEWEVLSVVVQPLAVLLLRLPLLGLPRPEQVYSAEHLLGVEMHLVLLKLLLSELDNSANLSNNNNSSLPEEDSVLVLPPPLVHSNSNNRALAQLVPLVELKQVPLAVVKQPRPNHLCSVVGSVAPKQLV